MRYKVQYHYKDDIHSFEFHADGFENDGTYIKFWKYVGPFVANPTKIYSEIWNNKEIHSIRVLEII